MTPSLWVLRAILTGMLFATRLPGKRHRRRQSKSSLRVVHLSPCFFSDGSVIGGGERYAQSLAAAVARRVETVFVSFGAMRQSLVDGALRIEIYPVKKLMGGLRHDPLSYSFLREITQADIVHCHQYWTAVTSLAIAAGAALGKGVFVTDEGGRGTDLVDELHLERHVDAFLPISEFSAGLLPQTAKSRLIMGGVHPRFTGAPDLDSPREGVLFAGRIMPHKGINYLIDALDPAVRLTIVGRAYDAVFLTSLAEYARGKNVTFVTDASDDQLIQLYRSAMVTVLPSVYRDLNGVSYPYPELLGLVLLESMACGTPVICTKVGALPEVVDDGVTGFIVAPNDPTMLKERIEYLKSNPDVAHRMGLAGRARVLRDFTWDAVVARCMAAYAEAS